MLSARAPVKNSILRNLPSVDELLRSETGSRLTASAGESHAASLARNAIALLRDEIISGTKESLLLDAENKLKAVWRSEQMTGTRLVINATGVIIHTNLGRASLSENAKQAMIGAAGYCSLEYDIETGKRGRRGSRAEDLIKELTGAEDALIVNNCAAAAFFILTVFASGGEVIISRGELVEIGGDFRVPDVLSQSGAKLREVGTTNRTKLADYEKAIGAETRMILRVHPSNYKIVGFTATPTVAELAALAKKHGQMLYEDLGSGALMDLSNFGLADEPVVSRSIADGADVVSFSGDKLLGGPQTGIIAGKRKIVDKLRKHLLYRTLRVDKIAYAALEATLEAYQRGTHFDEIPVLKMLSMTDKDLRKRAQSFADRLKSAKKLSVDLIDGSSVIGGGSAPDVHPATTLISLHHDMLSAGELEQKLRKSEPSVISRIEKDRVLLDLRTISENDEALLLEILTKTD